MPHLRLADGHGRGSRIHGTTKEAPWLASASGAGRCARCPTRPTRRGLKHATLHRDLPRDLRERSIRRPIAHRRATVGARRRHDGHDLPGVQVVRCIRAPEPGDGGPQLRRSSPPTKLAGCRSRRFPAAPGRADRPATLDVVERLLDERPVDRLRTAHAILKLARKVAAHRLDAACARALAFDDVGYTTIKRILDRGLDRVPIPTAAAAVLPTSTATLRFARPASDFFPAEA